VKRTLDGINRAAERGAKTVNGLTGGLEVRVERLVNAEPHVPMQSNILASSINGAGRLLRNVTLEVGGFVSNVGKSVVNLARNTAGAFVQTGRESATRLRNIRGRRPGQVDPAVVPEMPRVEIPHLVAPEPGSEPAAAGEQDGHAPNELELKKKESSDQ